MRCTNCATARPPTRVCELIVHHNPEAQAQGINPFDHGALHTDMWKTEGLKQALDAHGFDAAFGGARRDEEKSRAKERVFSFRSASHRWDPKNQRPEMWNLYNARHARGETMRIFPLSNWTELDIWEYIAREKIEIVSLYFAARRPTVERDGMILMVDDDRFPLDGETPVDAHHPLPHTRLLPPDGRSREQGCRPRRRHRRNARCDDQRTSGPRHRQGRRQRRYGAQEAGRLLLMKTLLRFIACGSVDDGKSTLIGRLLHDSKALFADQVAELEAESRRVGTQGEAIDYALLVDGLTAEREQGITIDVAYRFFATETRKYIVADTPGHEQYTRNMVTGASTADAAVILIDARKGVLTQTRRHSYLAHLLGIRHIVLAVTKMDLVGYDQAIYDAIVADYASFAQSLGIENFTPIPVSGFKGDNISSGSARDALVRRPVADRASRRDRPGASRRTVPHAGPTRCTTQSRFSRLCRVDRIGYRSRAATPSASSRRAERRRSTA